MLHTSIEELVSWGWETDDSAPIIAFFVSFCFSIPFFFHLALSTLKSWSIILNFGPGAHLIMITKQVWINFEWMNEWMGLFPVYKCKNTSTCGRDLRNLLVTPKPSIAKISRYSLCPSPPISPIWRMRVTSPVLSWRTIQYIWHFMF